MAGAPHTRLQECQPMGAMGCCGICLVAAGLGCVFTASKHILVHHGEKRGMGRARFYWFLFDLLFNLFNYFLINSIYFFILFHGTQRRCLAECPNSCTCMEKSSTDILPNILLFLSGFGMTWGWVNDVRLHFCLKYPLIEICLSVYTV